MSIASRINAIEEHLEDDYSVLEVAGADLTNVDKNIINLKPTWQERLLYFMNNGTDVVWNNWDKVVGEGESLSLNNTVEARMKIELKGNTNQFTTTGANILNPSYATHNCSVSGNDITITSSGTDIYLAGGYSTSMPTLFTVPAGTYYALCNNSKAYINVYGIYDGETTIRGISSNGVTFNQTFYVKGIRIRSEDGTTNLQNEVVNLYVGTPNSYEPYTGGIASPNPSYPQDIQVVSGDNSIKVEGEQLFQNEYIGTQTETPNAILKAGTYTLATCDGNNFGKAIYYRLIDMNNNFVNESGHLTSTDTTINFSSSSHYYYGGATRSSTTFTIDKDYKLGIGLLDSDSTRKVMLVKDSEAVRTYQPYQSQTYPINLGDIELCKIGTYQDRIVKDNGKWYLNKQIGKVVLDGSESGWEAYRGNYGWCYYKKYTTIAKDFTNLYCVSNYFTYNTATDDSNIGYFNIGGHHTSKNGNIVFNPFGDSENQKSVFLTWLSTHNTIVYYPLETPTSEEITDTTLLSQLNALGNANSYNNQTNISQDNNDLASILSVSALEEM